MNGENKATTNGMAGWNTYCLNNGLSSDEHYEGARLLDRPITLADIARAARELVQEARQ